jgi:hypothetical protein
MGISAGLGTAGLQPAVCTSTTRPASPYEGQMIYETDTDLTYLYSGSAWTQISGSTAKGNSGLVYITEQTVGTGVSSVTLSNVFSATYDNYRVVYSGGTGSGEVGLGMRVGGVTTNYSHMLFWATFAAGTANTDRANDTGSAALYLGSCGANGNHLAVDVLSPFQTKYTGFMAGSYIAADFGICVARHNIAASYTSVSILPVSGTISGGIVRVYGYRQA